jgi:hypothetical protein
MSGLEHVVGSVVQSHAAAAAAIGAARGIGSTIGATAARTGIRAIRGGGPEAKALDEAIAIAFIRVIADSRRDPIPDDSDWWENVGKALQAGFGSAKLKRQLAIAFLAEPDSPEFGTTALMNAMELAGNPLDELDGFNIDVEQFLHLLPGTITDELAWGSYKDASPLRGLFDTTLLQKIATLLASDRVASLSPFAVREQLVAFLTSVDQWAALDTGTRPAKKDRFVRLGSGPDGHAVGLR